MSNRLFAPFKRNVFRVELPVRKDLEIYVLQKTAGESLRYGELVDKIAETDEQRRERFVPFCIATHVCDAEGKPLLTEDEAKVFVSDYLYPLDVKAIMEAAVKANSVSDEALGEAEKK